MVKHRTMFAVTISIIAFITQQGCKPPISHLQPIWLEKEPLISHEKDFEFDKSDYKTFSIMPSTKMLEKSRITSDIQEKHLMYQLRNFLEQKGYIFVDPNRNPDLIAIIDGDAVYKTHYVPSSEMIVPQWVAGKTTTVTTNSRESASAYGTAGWADAYGTGTSTSYISTPGHMASTVVTRPGYEQGYYYPSLFIGLYNAVTNKIVWKGNGVGTSQTADLRISGQILISRIINLLPAQERNIKSKYTNQVGRIGVTYRILTIDGNDYFPTITVVEKKFPAEKIGLKENDVIVKINDVSCKNITESECEKLFLGPPGSKIHLTIWRNGYKEHHEFDIIRAKRE